jgi:CheY-like chemotaxis protein
MRILYIEDNPKTVRMISKMLGTAGYRLTSAPDVRIGLRQAIRDMPDVILMDYDLPYVNGLEAVALLRNSVRLKATPIIMVTASATDAEAGKFFEAGCDGFVPKPVSKDRLISTIQAVKEQPSARQNAAKTNRD